MTTQENWAELNNLANSLKSSGHPDRALPLYTRAFALAPTELEPPYNLALTLIDLGLLADAEPFLRHALTLSPRLAPAHHNLANVLTALHRFPEAEPHYRAALTTTTEPEAAAKLHNNLALCLRRLHRFADAEHHYRTALELSPTFATAWCNFGDFLAQHGHMDSAIAALRQALTLDPTHSVAHSNLLFTLGHTALTPEALFAEHLAFADHFETPLLNEQFYPISAPSPTHVSFRANPDRAKRVEGEAEEPRNFCFPSLNDLVRAAARPGSITGTNTPQNLRLAFVSADLRDHPLVRYLRPALTALAADPNLTLIAYNNHPHHDAETAACQQQFHEWHNVAHLTDAALATLIHSHHIDILFDLAGHSGFNRLLTFARRPAPVQISWMGYVGTTGLRSMDYLLADEHLIPPAMEPQFTERILRVPATTTFAPCADAPLVNELPALTTGTFTFASLARANKLSQPLIALWSRILHATPASRLMLATLPDGTPPPTVLAWFAEQGIDASRLHFVHPRNVHEMLRLHHSIDLNLDTTPYNGSTTNSHAAWMGVPTLTLTGPTAPSRMGTALNLHLGLQGFTVTTAEDYLALATAHTHDLTRLSDIRGTLRSHFAASLLHPQRAS